MGKVANSPSEHLTHYGSIKPIFEQFNLSKKEHGCYIGSSPYASGVHMTHGMNHSYITSTDPTTGEELGTVCEILPQEYYYVIQQAQKAFLVWREVPMPKRGLVLLDIGKALEEVQEPLGELIAIEMGKPRSEGIAEVREFVLAAIQVAGQAGSYSGPTIRSERRMVDISEGWHPYGIFGIFTAFNFPIAVLGWNRCLSAVCGNVDIWKPSSLTPFTSIAVQKICSSVAARHGHPNIFNLVIGSGKNVGKLMLEDPRIRRISFTGSTETGKVVARAVAPRFQWPILELGGNNAVIVTEDADLDLAVYETTRGVVGTSGQRCTSTRRAIVHESIADEFCKRLAEAFTKVEIGDPLEGEVHMGPLVTEDAVLTGRRAVKRAIDEGGALVVTDTKIEKQFSLLRFMSPHLVRMPSQTPIVKEETFAPILYVMTYKTFDEAIAVNNDVPQGLSSSIFTTDLRKAKQFLSDVGSDCGIANVNVGTSGAEIGGAFGGEKETGGGREMGSDCWKYYMWRQTRHEFWGSLADLELAQGLKFEIE